MVETIEENETSVQGDIDSLYAAAEAAERGDVIAEVAEKTPNGDAGTEEEQAAKADESLTTDSETETASTDPSEQDSSEQDSSEQDSSEQDSSEQDSPKSKRQERKDQALDKSWDNANRRHQEADQRESSLTKLESQVQQLQAQLKEQAAKASPEDPYPNYTVDQIQETLVEALDEGDVDLVKTLAEAITGKAKAMAGAVAHGMDNPEFAADWDKHRSEAVRSTPELADPKSPLFTAATGLLSGEWKDVFQSHPVGVKAAVAVAKLQLQAESVSELGEKVNQLEAENKKLRKATAIDATTTTARATETTKRKQLSVQEEIDGLYALAERG